MILLLKKAHQSFADGWALEWGRESIMHDAPLLFVSSYYMIIIHLSLLLLHLGIMDPFLYSKHSAICIWRAPFVSLFILFGLCMNKNTRVEWFCQIDCQNNYNKLQINNWTRSFDPTIPIWLLSCENTVSELSLSYRQSFPDASTSFST